MQKMDYSLAPSERVEQVLGAQLNAVRLAQNITQETLAERAGVSRSTVNRLGKEDKGISLDSLIRIMQALGLAGRLESLMPDMTVRPLDRLEQGEAARQRARESSGGSGAWLWDDEPGS